MREGLFTNHGRHLEAVESGTEYTGGVPVTNGNIEGRAFNGSAMAIIVGATQPISVAITVDLTADQCHELTALFGQMAKACDRAELVADLDGEA